MLESTLRSLFFLIIFLAYVNFIMVKLVWQRRVVPIYNRPFPWTWNLVIDSLKTDARNLKIILFEIFPWWKELILGCAVVSLFLITCFVFPNGLYYFIVTKIHSCSLE